MTSPVSWPLSKLLDCALGKHSGTFYRRSELKQLLKFHQHEHRVSSGHTPGLDGLRGDEVAIIHQALDLYDKTAEDLMIPLDRVSAVSDSEVLTDSLIRRLLRAGYSRVPVYAGQDKTVLR
jgi:metal transporter CNNM